MVGKTIRNWWWVPTLAVTFAAGWALASAGNPGRLTDSEAFPPVRKTKSSERRDLLDRSNPAARLVWDMLEEMDVTPAADRAAAARAAIDAWLGDGRDQRLHAAARIRFAHWLETDPKAAMAYWSGSGTGKAVAALASVARDHLITMDPGKLLDWFVEDRELANGAVRDVMLMALAKGCADGRNVKVLDRARTAIDPASARRLMLLAITGWPPDGLKPLERCIRENPDPVVVQTFVSRLEPAQSVAWIRNEIATHGSLAEILKQQGVGDVAVRAWRGASVKERTALYEELTGQGARPGFTPSFLLDSDVNGWLDLADGGTGSMTDWRHRLRLGEISASQIMEEARRAMPAIAAELPDEFRDRMLGIMALVNPTSAMELISGLPLQQRERAMIKAGMSMASRADPQRLLELVSTLPPTSATRANDRFQIWCRAAVSCYSMYGESYVTWVAAMSPGIERDWALSSLVTHFQTSDPEKSAHLKTLKTLPPGWRPDQ